MIKRFLAIFITILLFYSCLSDKPDISTIAVDNKIIRMDKLLFEKNVETTSDWLPNLVAKYPDFMDIYSNNVIKTGATNKKEFQEKMKYFIVYTTTYELDKAIEKEFTDFDKIENKVNTSLKYFKYYFPSKKIPEIYTFISGFNQSVIIGKNFVGIGLDKYLGQKNYFYEDIKMPMYLRFKTNKEFIPIDIEKAIAYYNFYYPDTSLNLLNKIIYEGKIQYFIDKMFPDADDTLKIAYTSKQMNWCKQNEENVWTWFVANNKLMMNDFIKIKRYCDEAPFTSDFSKESPGRIGVWIGWQIIRSYMKNHPNVSLAELMADNDFQKIMNLSKYNP